jgi:hypothetical protein
LRRNVDIPFWQAACLKFQQETHPCTEREREREREKGRAGERATKTGREIKRETLYFTPAFFPLSNIRQKVARVPVFQSHF